MTKSEYGLFLRTICNKKRLEIINLLRKDPKTVTEIYKSLKFNQTTVSRHLVCLERCGFVKVKQKAKYRIYSINKETIEPLMKLMDKHTKKFCRKLYACKEIGGK